MMETFRITFCHNQENQSSTVEMMVENEESVINIFQNIEPFVIILKVEKI